MKDKASLFWILILLAALFLGPIIVEKTGRTVSRSQSPLNLLDREQNLLDAPANKPASPPR